MYKDIIEKTILKITRRDEFGEYDSYSPLGLFLDFGESHGLYFGVTNDKAMTVKLLTREELIEYTGFEYSECDLNDLLIEDELNKLIGEKVKEIKLAKFNEPTIKGETFEIQLGHYAGIKIKTDSNVIVFFNNEYGHLLVNDGDGIPDKERWTWE